MAQTVLIVDDHATFRTRARRVLEADGFAVIGEAPDLATGLALAADLGPEIILLDVHLPDGNGVEAAPRFAALARASNAESAATRAPRIVICSSYDAEDVGDLESAGVQGFITKSELSGAALAGTLTTPGAP